MKKIGYLLVFFAAAVFSSCSDNDNEVGETIAGSAYFPLNIGDFRIYNVEDRRWLQNKVVDSSMFQLRERIDTVFTNLAGETTYRIVRSKRLTAADQWADDSVITATVTGNQVKRTSDNLTEVKMVFPVAENKAWNPNVYNTREPGNAHYADIKQPLSYTLGNNVFQKTLKVVVSDFESVINHDFREEVYAENVGLIYKKYDVINFCNVDICDFDPTFILTGHLRIETIDSYGHSE
jgi:hypothetical protein